MSEVGDEVDGRLALRFQAGLDWVIDGRQMQRGRDIGLLWHTKSGRRQQEILLISLWDCLPEG